MAIINIQEQVKKIGKMGSKDAAEYRKKVLLSSVGGKDRSDLLTACDERLAQFGDHSPLVVCTDLNDFEVMSDAE